MKVVTAVVNNPDFIIMQYESLKKYFKGEYEFIVFNDAKDWPDFTNNNDITVKQQIIDTCAQLGIQCINIPNGQHRRQIGAAERCADSMNYILKYQLANPDRYLCIDSDMFLVADFDTERYAGYDCAIVLQHRHVAYFWNGIYYFDIQRMKYRELLNWNCMPGCDVGGRMHEWLKLQTPVIPTGDELRWSKQTFHTANTYFIKHLWSCTWDESELPEGIRKNAGLVEFLRNDPRNVKGKFFCEIYDNVFFHYRAGGNWRREGMGFHHALTEKLKINII